MRECSVSPAAGLVRRVIGAGKQERIRAVHGAGGVSDGGKALVRFVKLPSRER